MSQPECLGLRGTNSKVPTDPRHGRTTGTGIEEDISPGQGDPTKASLCHICNSVFDWLRDTAEFKAMQAKILQAPLAKSVLKHK